ncbi:MAG TPA: gamma-glutamyltransferase [Polyangium sp.]|nr:gamma-glutamyltransferase [Polyangium sp.]
MRTLRALSTASFAAALALLVALPGSGCSAPAARSPDESTAKAPPAAPTPAAPPANLIPQGTAQAPAPAAPAAPTKHKYAVATENATASAIAMDVLARGGSAVDAAIAGALAIGVVHPVSSGLGGGGFATVYDAKTKEIRILDFRETAPKDLVPTELAKRPVPEGQRGVMTGVPGEVAGIAEMHARWGKLAMADLVRGAADTAEKGFPVSAHMIRALKWNEKWLLSSPRYGLFAKAGAIVPAGEIVKNPALAATLRRIGAEGKKAFYEGSIAADILATARAGKCRMTKKDLEDYKVLDREPLRTQWEGYEVVTMPPPSAGGVMMLETLHMHSKADLAALGHNTGAYTHLLAETMRGAVADRVRLLGDPAFVKMDVAKLVSAERMKARRARISMTSTTKAENFPVTDAGTTHIVTVDAEGNVASITTTVNNMFGSQLVTEGGFLLNDELADFTAERVEKLFGMSKGPNYPRGGARPTSSMTPTIVTKDGKPVLALGGSGGTRIATGTTQVLLSHLVFGMPVDKAVAAPRFETPPTGGLFIDAAIGTEVLQDLEKRGEVVDTSKPNFSAVQAVSIQEGPDGARVLSVGADPRKGGAGLVQ